MPLPRILLANSHQVLIEGLAKLLEREFQVVGLVVTGGDLLAAAKEQAPDVILTDCTLPSLSGMELLHELRKLNSRARVVFLTALEDPVLASTVMDAGAKGYVLKSASTKDLTAALREALKGGRWISPSVSAAIAAAKPLRRGSRPLLTERQRQILGLLTKGLSAKEIAGELKLSRRTVEYHKYRMMDQLGIRTTAELIQYAIRLGYGGSP